MHIRVSKVIYAIAISVGSNHVFVSAVGQVNSGGWSNGDLQGRLYINPPEDGVLDLDFVATPPEGLAIQVLSEISASVALELPDWCQSIRIHGTSNSVHLARRQPSEIEAEALTRATNDHLASPQWSDFGAKGSGVFPWLVPLTERQHRAAMGLICSPQTSAKHMIKPLGGDVWPWSESEKNVSPSDDSLDLPIRSLLKMVLRSAEAGAPHTGEFNENRVTIFTDPATRQIVEIKFG